MDAAFVKIVVALVARHGRDLLLDASRCKSLLADELRGEFRKERRLLSLALDVGAPKEIGAARDLASCNLQLVRRLQDEFFIQPASADEVVDLLILLLRGVDTSGVAPGDAASAAPAAGANAGVAAFCRFCGKPVAADARFCGRCGKFLEH